MGLVSQTGALAPDVLYAVRMIERNVIEIVERWLEVLAILSRHPGGVVRTMLARQVGVDPRTLRRDVARMNEIAARSNPGLPMHWPRIETQIVGRRAVLSLAGSPHEVVGESLVAEVHTAVFEVRGDLAKRDASQWPGVADVHPLEAGRAELTLVIPCPLPTLADWVVRQGPEIVALAPHALVDEVRRHLISRILDHADDPARASKSGLG